MNMELPFTDIPRYTRQVMAYRKLILLIVGVGLAIICGIWAYDEIELGLRNEWMRQCTVAASIKHGWDGDRAFAHCLEWREWLDKHDRENWR